MKKSIDLRKNSLSLLSHHTHEKSIDLRKNSLSLLNHHTEYIFVPLELDIVFERAILECVSTL